MASRKGLKLGLSQDNNNTFLLKLGRGEMASRKGEKIRVRSG